jgi:hypothetical protein
LSVKESPPGGNGGPGLGDDEALEGDLSSKDHFCWLAVAAVGFESVITIPLTFPPAEIPAGQDTY